MFADSPSSSGNFLNEMFDGGFDAFDEDDDYFFRESEADQGSAVNLKDFEASAWQRLYQHYVCAFGSSSDPSRFFLTEAELHIQAHDYKQALTCTVAADSIDKAHTNRVNMLKVITLYQLGDKKQAIAIKDALLETGFNLDDEEIPGVSAYLIKRFRGTCEVLGMMPELLGMLRNMSKNKSNKHCEDCDDNSCGCEH